MTAHNHCL